MSKQLELAVWTSCEGDVVAIFGVGRLGHLATQFASWSSCHTANSAITNYVNNDVIKMMEDQKSNTSKSTKQEGMVSF